MLINIMYLFLFRLISRHAVLLSCPHLSEGNTRGHDKQAILMASHIYAHISGHKNCHFAFRFSILHSRFSAALCPECLFVFCLVSCHFEQQQETKRRRFVLPEKRFRYENGAQRESRFRILTTCWQYRSYRSPGTGVKRSACGCSPAAQPTVPALILNIILADLTLKKWNLQRFVCEPFDKLFPFFAASFVEY